MRRQSILWCKLYQCFLRSASQGNRNKSKTKQMLPNQAYTAMRSKPVNPKGNQSWIFITSTDAESEAPILWPHDVKSWLIGKDPDAGKDWGQEENGTTENEMVRWHRQLNGHEFEQILRDSKAQGTQACCSPWAHKELDTQSIWTTTIGASAGVKENLHL